MSTKENPQVGASEIHVYAGTAGHSAWFSDDLGMTWVHPNSHSGMYLEARVWALSTHSALPESLHAGTDEGVFGWSEHSARWEHLSRMLNDVWAVLHDPRDPSILYAGTRPAGLYRSTDGGRVLTELAAPGIAKFSNVNMGPTRVTQLLADPFVPDRLWATVEIGGIYRSDDRGSSWRLMADGLVSADVHGIAVTRTKSGAPRVPDDLRSHRCITHAYVGRTEFRLQRDGRMLRIPVKGQLQSNEAAVTRRAVLAGAGIAMLPTYFVSADLASGELIRLLPDCEPEPLGIHAAYLSRQHQPQLLRMMVDFLADRMRGEVAPWDRVIASSTKQATSIAKSRGSANGKVRRRPKAS